MTYFRHLIIFFILVHFTWAQTNDAQKRREANKYLQMGKKSFAQSKFQQALQAFALYKKHCPQNSYQAFEAGNFKLEAALQLKDNEQINKIIAEQDQALLSARQQVSQDALCHYLFIAANKDYEESNYSKTYKRLSVLLKRQLSADGSYVADSLYLLARSSIDLALQYEDNYQEYLQKSQAALALYRKFKGPAVDAEIQVLFLELKIFKGELSEAEADFTKSNFTLKKDLKTFLKLALDLRKKKWDDAYQSFHGLNTKNFKHSQKIPVLAKLAAALIKEKDERRGLEILTSISKNARYDYEKRALIALQLKIALSQQNLDDVRQEFESFQDFYSDHQDFITLAFQTSQFMQNQGKYQEALSIYKTLLQKHQKSLSTSQKYDAFFQRAFCYENLKDFTTARANYKVAASLELSTPFKAAATFKLGFVSMKLQETQVALQYWQEVIDLNSKPWSLKAKIESARLVYQEQNYQSAATYLDQIFKTPALNEKIKKQLLLIWADCLIKQGDIAKAQTLLEEDLDSVKYDELAFQKALLLEQTYTLTADTQDKHLKLLDRLSRETIKLKHYADELLFIRAAYFIAQANKAKARAEYDKLLLSADKGWQIKALKALTQLDLTNPDYFDEFHKNSLKLISLLEKAEEKEFYTLKLQAFLIQQPIEKTAFNSIYNTILTSALQFSQNSLIYQDAQTKALNAIQKSDIANKEETLYTALLKLHNSKLELSNTTLQELGAMTLHISDSEYQAEALDLFEQIIAKLKTQIQSKEDYIKALYLEARYLQITAKETSAQKLFKRILLYYSAQAQEGHKLTLPEISASYRVLKSEPKLSLWLEKITAQNPELSND